MKKAFGMVCVCMAMACLAGNDGGDEFDWPPPTGVGRGLVNVVTSPGEIFRDMSYYGGKGYETAGEPGAFFGGVFGVVPGAVMCAARIVDGVADCFTLGIWGNSVTHSSETADFFPTFFWEDVWLPESLSGR